MLIGALVLGLLIGMLVTGRYTRHKVVQIKELGTPEGMHRQFYKLIDPSEEQEALIRPVLYEYAIQSQEMRQRHWMNIRNFSGRCRKNWSHCLMKSNWKGLKF